MKSKDVMFNTRVWEQEAKDEVENSKEPPLNQDPNDEIGLEPELPSEPKPVTE